MAERWGCHKTSAMGPLSDRFPGQFDGLTIDRCPWHILNQRDPFREEIMSIVRDYQAGTIRGFPDRYSAGTVDAVRYVLGTIDWAQGQMMDRIRAGR